MRGGNHRQFAVDGFGLENPPDDAARDVEPLSVNWADSVMAPPPLSASDVSPFGVA
jgi:hypothetical protein